MQIKFGRRLLIYHLQEPDELLVPVPRHARADDAPLDQLDGGEQRRGAMSDVVMRHGFAVAGKQGQAALRTVESLNLALLIDTQHQGMSGRIQVEAHVGFPDAMHRRLAGAQGLGQRARGPVRGVGRLLARGLLDDQAGNAVTLRRAPAAARCISLDAANAAHGETRSPADHRVRPDVQHCGNLLVHLALGSHQHDLGPRDQSRRRATPTRSPGQRRTFALRQRNLWSNSHRFILPSESRTGNAAITFLTSGTEL